MTFLKKTPDNPPPAEYVAVPADVRDELIPIGEESPAWRRPRALVPGQFEAAKSWQHWNLILGVPASIFGHLQPEAPRSPKRSPRGSSARRAHRRSPRRDYDGVGRGTSRHPREDLREHVPRHPGRRPSPAAIDLASMDPDEAHAALTRSATGTRRPVSRGRPGARFYSRAKSNLTRWWPAVRDRRSQDRIRSTRYPRPPGPATSPGPTLARPPPIDTPADPAAAPPNRRTDHG